ncbi:hypothetical protein [Entomohabitans teleogrylli]|uniref:hypothetical protein n=1 Tax=Entomohabitans teleogrylli TaxID=1384589 RepID=UPI00073D27E5|nr:hypothetical protein [Entomohabitans teleogrylli]
MNKRTGLLLLATLSLCACRSPAPPAPDKDAIVTSKVDGVVLHHRFAIKPPEVFTPINEEYLTLYSVSVMDSPGYGGSVVTQLENAAPFYALGRVEGSWLAISRAWGGNLTGYIVGNAGIPKDQHRAAVLKDRAVLRARARSAAPAKPASGCIDVADSKACQDGGSATWILD